MNYTNTDNIACLIFGHNYYKSKEKSASEITFVCKNCKKEITAKEYHNTHAKSKVDKTFETELKKLFLLRRSLAI